MRSRRRKAACLPPKAPRPARQWRCPSSRSRHQAGPAADRLQRKGRASGGGGRKPAAAVWDRWRRRRRYPLQLARRRAPSGRQGRAVKPEPTALGGGPEAAPSGAGRLTVALLRRGEAGNRCYGADCQCQEVWPHGWPPRGAAVSDPKAELKGPPLQPLQEARRALSARTSAQGRRAARQGARTCTPSARRHAPRARREHATRDLISQNELCVQLLICSTHPSSVRRLYQAEGPGCADMHFLRPLRHACRLRAMLPPPVWFT